MHEHWLFLWNVCSHLVASMSGVASFCLSMWEHARQKKIESRVFFVVGFLCLIVAFDQAWQDEHRNSQILIEQKTSLASEAGFWKEQAYSKDAVLASRDNLLTQNYVALLGEQNAATQSQASLAQLSAKILDMGKTEPQKFTYGMNAWSSDMHWKRYVSILVTSNHPARASLRVSCDGEMEIIDASIFNGGPHFPNSVIKRAPNVYDINIPSPEITDRYPLVITSGTNLEHGPNCKVTVI